MNKISYIFVFAGFLFSIMLIITIQFPTEIISQEVDQEKKEESNAYDKLAYILKWRIPPRDNFSERVDKLELVRDFFEKHGDAEAKEAVVKMLNSENGKPTLIHIVPFVPLEVDISEDLKEIIEDDNFHETLFPLDEIKKKNEGEPVRYLEGAFRKATDVRMDAMMALFRRNPIEYRDYLITTLFNWVIQGLESKEYPLRASFAGASLAAWDFLHDQDVILRANKLMKKERAKYEIHTNTHRPFKKGLADKNLIRLLNTWNSRMKNLFNENGSLKDEVVTVERIYISIDRIDKAINRGQEINDQGAIETFNNARTIPIIRAKWREGRRSFPKEIFLTYMDKWIEQAEGEKEREKRRYRIAGFLKGIGQIIPERYLNLTDHHLNRLDRRAVLVRNNWDAYYPPSVVIYE